jgi:hypothetical protein
LFVKDNPCDNCLIKICCTKLCDDKLKYTDDLISHLTYFIDKYTVQKRGQRYPIPKRVPAYQQREWDHVKQLCRKSRYEAQEIFMRTVWPEIINFPKLRNIDITSILDEI